MKVLLDTHTLVWAVSHPEVLSPMASKVLRQSEIIVSVVSLWELILKKSKKDRLLDDPVPWWNLLIIRPDIHVISIQARHVAALDGLPEIHKDPFDRILLAQAITENAAILSRDRALAEYGVRVIW